MILMEKPKLTHYECASCKVAVDYEELIFKKVYIKVPKSASSFTEFVYVKCMSCGWGHYDTPIEFDASFIFDPTLTIN